MRITLTEKEFEKIIENLSDEELKALLKEKRKKFEESITEKLKASTKAANEAKIKESMKKVKNAIRILELENKKINAYSISKVANITYPTARKYYNKIKEESLIKD